MRLAARSPCRRSVKAACWSFRVASAARRSVVSCGGACKAPWTMVTTTFTAGGGEVLAACASTLISFDVNSGNVLWKTQLGTPSEQGNVDGQVFIQSQMAVHGARVFVGAWGVPHGTVSAYDTSDGALLWQWESSMAIYFSPAWQ